MDKSFTFTQADAAEIAHIMQRNQDNAAFLHKLLVRAEILEELYCANPAPEE